MIGMGDRAMSETFLMDRLEEVLSICGEDILDRLGTGHVSPAAYDTGFVARISDEEGNPEFPQTLDWLVANQRDDGSWGSDIHHAYDRFINTLSASIALKERGHAPEAVALAEAYLSEAIHVLTEDDEGVSSDHVVAMLMEEAKQIGLEVPHEANPHKGKNLLQKAIMNIRYVDPEHPLAFYSEILGRMPNQKRITRKLQMENGSISSSPASTAASIVWDSTMRRDHAYFDKLRFLNECIDPDGGVKHFSSQDTMELVYSLYNLVHVKPFERTFREKVLLLKKNWREDGLSFGSHFNVPDLDNTAMGFKLLASMGHEPDPFVFDKYWKGEFYVTYRVHDKGHVCPNIHTLEAIAISSHPWKDDIIDKTLRFLRSKMIDGNHFQDYWHLSPAYPTCHAIFAFHLTEETLMERCVDYFLDTQRDDGSWGFTSNGNGLGADELGTIEETAFALQGLLYYNQHVQSIDLGPVQKGVEYILERFPSAKYPEMWWAKVLNTYRTMLESCAIGALMMYRQAVGGSTPWGSKGEGRREIE